MNKEDSSLEPQIKSVQDVFKSKYVIPLYQRNFTWGEDQVVQLIRDVYQAFKEDKQHKYFLGTLVLKQRSVPNDTRLEVIDGQQRLTVLSLIKRIINTEVESDTHNQGNRFVNRLFYDSRKEVTDYLSLQNYDECNVSAAIASLVEATKTIKKTSLSVDEKLCFGMLNDGNNSRQQLEEFSKFFLNNVKLVCVNLPQNTDVTKYFEIMNNRGEQLKDHELLKARLLGKIENKKRKSLQRFGMLVRKWIFLSKKCSPKSKI